MEKTGSLPAEAGVDGGAGASDKAADFDKVFRAEQVVVNDRRRETGRPEAGSLDPHTENDYVGLALSGGGIRSAAFCFGALQALDAKSEILKRLDYLSTVSGGGYIGCCLAIGLKVFKGAFPFPSELGKEEAPSVSHLRNFSNYLFADRFLSVLGGVGAIVLGIFCNFLMILPVLLALALATYAAFPTLASLRSAYEAFLIWPFQGEAIGAFPVSRTGAGFFVLMCAVAILAAIFRPVRSLQRRTRWRRAIGWVCLIVLGLLALELNFLALATVLKEAEGERQVLGYSFTETGSFLAVLTAVLTLGRNVIERLRVIGEKYQDIWSKLAKHSGNFLYLLLAAIVPLLVWIAYAALYLSFVQLDAKAVGPVVVWGLSGAVVLFLVMGLVSPNAFSLHSLYRDRLAKGFVHTFKKDGGQGPVTGHKFSKLLGCEAPYLLVNSALNIQGSKVVNRRGRNADFFMFSPLYTGSRPTGYCSTEKMEDQEAGFDVATGMAISGAAASANMGNKTVSLLVFSLSLLNIRLGYWLANPGEGVCGEAFAGLEKLRRWVGLNVPLGPYWFFREVRGNLTEKCTKVYLSDGGHIENLGLYELLQRRCRVIIACDAEADPQMTFPSFMLLQQYARIDMGVRIELAWQKVQEATLAQSQASGQAVDGEEAGTSEGGPHAAIGIIHYDNEPVGSETAQKGVLIYLKSSLTGDEADYIRDYKRRSPSFPHETTLDQLFSEEQFEVYRALGFHAAGGVVDGQGKLQVRGGEASDAQTAFIIETVKSCLGLELDKKQFI